MGNKQIDDMKRRLESEPDNKDLQVDLLNLRARHEGETVYLDLLSDRLVWNQSEESLQARAIEIAGQKLGPDYLWLETQLYQCAEIAHRIGSFTHLKTGAILHLLPGGSYLMGSHDSEQGRRDHEGPVHQVMIKPFLFGRFAVTQAQWEKFSGENPSRFKNAELPVEQISWEDCHAWLKKVGQGLRLPSESEWEYGCRSGSTTEFCFGNNITSSQVNFNGKRPYGSAAKGLFRVTTVRVGSLPCNAFGLHEVHGNIFEWCEDSYIDNYENAPIDSQHFSGKGSDRVSRGGCWLDDGTFCRSANRSFSEPTSRLSICGFRVAKTLHC